MAKRKAKEKIVLENVELQPQVIGYTYKKKSNVGRVVFIFICFALSIYYINEISLYLNRLLGKNTAETIQSQVNANKRPTNNDPIKGEDKEIVYNEISDTLEINEQNLIVNNFAFNNYKLTFDVSNNTGGTIDLSDKKYFIETYERDKTLIERVKVDFKSFGAGTKTSYSIDLNKSFVYVVLIEKTVEDYPSVEFESENGVINLTCTKKGESLYYTFKDDSLTNIQYTLEDNNTEDSEYFSRYVDYQAKANTYNGYDGITASFTSSLEGYAISIAVDLSVADISVLDEKYFYPYKEIPKVVYFEMRTYGFKCS